MKQNTKRIYILGVMFCLVTSIFLLYASYSMISWVLSDHPERIYSDYQYEPSGQHSTTDKVTIEGEHVFFQELGFEDYNGLIEVNYEISTISNNTTEGIEIYFVKSVEGYNQFIEYSESSVNDYQSCQKKDVTKIAASCVIHNKGGIIIYNAANKQKQVTLDLTIKYGPSLIESY